MNRQLTLTSLACTTLWLMMTSERPEGILGGMLAFVGFVALAIKENHSKHIERQNIIRDRANLVNSLRSNPAFSDVSTRDIEQAVFEHVLEARSSRSL